VSTVFGIARVNEIYEFNGIDTIERKGEY